MTSGLNLKAASFRALTVSLCPRPLTFQDIIDITVHYHPILRDLPNFSIRKKKQPNPTEKSKGIKLQTNRKDTDNQQGNEFSRPFKLETQRLHTTSVHSRDTRKCVPKATLRAAVATMRKPNTHQKTNRIKNSEV
ncbi:hypothetical protein V6N12_009785 [Hibiscus sabdariffa]|uniref:Uncharacterized protein n=1 Tax=Hibiscus sabdariffa TaxID=183260 RepID=A0ABR2EBS2_9ROSI